MNLSTIKNAVITTAMVVGVIYLVRQTAAGKNLIAKALTA